MIRVLFFGRVADLMGRRELDVEISAESLSLYTLRARLFEEAEVAKTQTIKILMSLNKDVVHDDRALKSGDEVAFFSPFSGG